MINLSIVLIAVGCGLITKGLGLGECSGSNSVEPQTIKVEMDRWERIKLAEALRRD